MGRPSMLGTGELFMSSFSRISTKTHAAWRIRLLSAMRFRYRARESRGLFAATCVHMRQPKRSLFFSLFLLKSRNYASDTSLCDSRYRRESIDALGGCSALGNDEVSVRDKVPDPGRSEIELAHQRM